MIKDLSFTQDPEWIAQRQALWGTIEDDVKDGLSKRETEKFRKYFFSGEFVKGIAAPSMLELFPSLDIEGLEYFFKHIFPKTNYFGAFQNPDESFKSIQRCFCIGKGFVGLGMKERLQLFKYVFGERWELGRKFPFLIGEEPGLRGLTLNQNDIYGSAMYNLYISLFGETDTQWYYLEEFFLSLLHQVDQQFFIDGGMVDGIGKPDLRRTKSRMSKVMTMCRDKNNITTLSDNVDAMRFLASLEEYLNSNELCPEPLRKQWNSILKN